MWIADGWKDYELLDCGGGEKLERWGDQILVRPDPQAIWESDRKNHGWRTANARYSRSSTGGGHWDKNKLPESWPISYKNLRFQVKPMNFKHTGLFPEQAANWDFAMDKISPRCHSSRCRNRSCWHTSRRSAVLSRPFPCRWPQRLRQPCGSAAFPA